MFKIISAGWECPDFLEWTLQSVAEQSITDWEMFIIDDASTDPRQAELIHKWCEHKDKRWRYRINTENLGTPRNQFEGITMMSPGPDDIIVFLDLDGDKLAHPDVLKNLLRYYADGTLVTYGSYRPVPDLGTSTPAKPFPSSVVANRSYRQAISAGHTGFNHLRTMKGKIFDAIPEDHFHWANGDWYKHGTDYIFMTAALELANGKYKCIDEVLVLYNHANPNADYLTKGPQSNACVTDYLKRAPLEPWTRELQIRYMSAEERRTVLLEYGQRFDLRVFIETGTNTGDTPWALKGSFDDLFTIELDDRLHRAAVRRFLNDPHVHVLQGDSTDVLPEVLNIVKGPALVWLDGHHSGPGTAHGALDTPVVQELETLFNDSRKHVILVDDARIFDGQPEHNDEPHYHDYPSVEWIAEQADIHGYDFELKDDIIRLTPRRAA